MATITGTIDADTLMGTTLQDFILGLEGDDVITGDEGDDTIQGGDGNDAIWGGDGNDIISGGFGDDVLHGGNGDDTLSGSSGNDNLMGDAGNDTLTGGSGDDTLDGGDGNDSIAGGDGNDTIIGSAGADNVTGGSGFDTLDYSASSVAINANLNTHVIDSELGKTTADGIESVIGSQFDDVLCGDGLANVLIGGDGNDLIRSRGGADTLTGGYGQDTYVFMQKDVLSGGVHLGVDFITDFRSSDKIDVRDFFKGQYIEDYNEVIHLTADGANTTLSVKSGNVFVDVVSFAGQFVVRRSLLSTTTSSSPNSGSVRRVCATNKRLGLLNGNLSLCLFRSLPGDMDWPGRGDTVSRFVNQSFINSYYGWASGRRAVRWPCIDARQYTPSTAEGAATTVTRPD